MKYQLLCLIAVSVLVGGCASDQERSIGTSNDPKAIGDQIGALLDKAPTRKYPDEVEIGDELEIEVRRHGDLIQIDNRTARSYENAYIWLNHQYGLPVSKVEVGVNGMLALPLFVNEFGERYPVGTFLTPEENLRLVMADLVVDGVMHKLSVRLDKDWQLPY